MAGFMKSALKALGLNKESGAPTDSMDLNEFLAEIASLSGFDIEFQASENNGSGTVYEITGTDAEEFLGNSSEMLEALAHISMRFQRRRAGVSNEPGAETSSEHRVSFDAGSFRERKTQELRDLAESKRQKVIEASGKPAYINALGPAERKVIHTYITETGDMVSESIGSGYFKRIRIRHKDDTRAEAGPRGNGGGGRRSGGQGRGPRGNGGGGRRGGGQGRGPRGNRGGDNFNRGGEPNGNVVTSERTYDDVDDNIGNRLAPGEEPLFSFDPHDSDSNKS
jgi:predicted RNA-binding protein Jag